MLNGVNAAEWRKNGMMEVGKGRVVGDVWGCGWRLVQWDDNDDYEYEYKKAKIIMIIFVMELRIMKC